MGKLGTVLTKKDYILKALPLPAQNGRKKNIIGDRELRAYIHTHLPALYPAPVDDSSIGYAPFGTWLLVFILQGKHEKPETEGFVVPFLLFGKGDEYTLRLEYPDGHEDWTKKSGSPPKATWSKGSFDKASDKEMNIVQLSDVKSILHHQGMRASKLEKARPFAKRRCIKPARIARFAFYILVIAICGTGITLTASARTSRERKALEADIRDLSSRASSIRKTAESDIMLRTELTALESVPVYSPYRILEAVYNATAESRQRTLVTSFRFSRNTVTIEGYTRSGLALLDAFRRSPFFDSMRLSSTAPSSASSGDTEWQPETGLEGFQLTGIYRTKGEQ